MSFVSILKTIGKDAVIGAQAATPVVAALNPVAGAALTGLTGLVVAAERLHPVPGSGVAKKSWVQAAVAAGVPIAEFVAQLDGKALKIDQQALNDAIDATVALLNATQRLAGSFSLETAAK